jgi:STE24 endopeptidase
VSTDTADVSNAADLAREITPAEQAEARRYGRISLILSLADMALDLVYLGLMAFVIARPLDTWLAGFPALAGTHSYLRLIAMVVIVVGLHVLVSAPLSFFSGYVVEHRFGLSNQSLGRWFEQWVKRNLLALVFGLLIYGGLFAIIWNTGRLWWVIAAVAFFLFSIILGQLVPVLILPLFQKVEKLDRPDLEERMHHLAEGTGLTIEGVYRLGMSEDTKKANAMLAGLGATRRVLMGDTLLTSFSPDEIDVIFAHEIGHHVHRHIHKMIFTGAAFSFAGLWIVDRVLCAWADVETAAEVGSAALPVVMFTLAVFMLLLEPLQNAISRHYERQCDRYALARTSDPQAYRSAFLKLARLNKADMHPHPVEVFLFDSHPPIAERLALAEE